VATRSGCGTELAPERDPVGEAATTDSVPAKQTTSHLLSDFTAQRE
jgi:hypothetical protein